MVKSGIFQKATQRLGANRACVHIQPTSFTYKWQQHTGAKLGSYACLCCFITRTGEDEAVGINTAWLSSRVHNVLVSLPVRLHYRKGIIGRYIMAAIFSKTGGCLGSEFLDIIYTIQWWY